MNTTTEILNNRLFTVALSGCGRGLEVGGGEKNTSVTTTTEMLLRRVLQEETMAPVGMFSS